MLICIRLSPSSISFSAMERQFEYSYRSGGKAGGPFETSITGTCHLVDVTTASEFVIMPPLSLSFFLPSLLSLSLSLSLSPPLSLPFSLSSRSSDLSLLIARIFGLARSWSAGQSIEFRASFPDLHWELKSLTLLGDSDRKIISLLLALHYNLIIL